MMSGPPVYVRVLYPGIGHGFAGSRPAPRGPV